MATRSTVRDQAVTKSGEILGLVAKLPYLDTSKIWRKERFALFFERPESASTISLGLVNA